MARIVLKNAVIELERSRILPDDLYVTSSSKILFVGQTGSGKTVLIKTLAGIMKDIHEARIYGTIIVDGSIHYIPQEPWPLNLGGTGIEELLLVSHLYRNHDESLMKTVLEQNMFLKKRIKEMSYGEKRVLEILKTLFIEPEILLIDEPYESLDTNNKRKVDAVINKSVEEYSAIVVATSKKPLINWSIYRVRNNMLINTNNDIEVDPVIDVFGRIEISQEAYVTRGNKKIKYPEIKLRPGEGITIIGPNGVGKTSLLLGIAGALKIHGEYKVSGSIGYVPDDVSMIFSWFKAVDVIRELCGNNGVCLDESIRIIGELGVLLNDKYFYELSDGEKRLLLLIPQIISGKSILLIDGGLEYIDKKRAEIIEKLLYDYLEAGGIVITTLPKGDDLDVLERLVLSTD